MLLSLGAIRIAAHKLLEAAIQDEIESSGAEIEESSPEDLAEKIMESNGGEMVMYIIGTYVGAIGQAWGHSVGLVFYHMGIADDPKESSRALYYLIMSCWGHGVSLQDYHSEAFSKANAILSKFNAKGMEHSPTYFDQHESFIGPVLSDWLQYPQEAE